MLWSATGAWTVSGTPTKLTQSSLRLSHSPYAPPHPSGLPRSPFQARPMPSLSAVTGTSSSPGPSGHPGCGTDTGPADSASQAGNAEEGVPIVLSYGSLHASLATVDETCCTSHSLWIVSVLRGADGLLHSTEQSRTSPQVD